MQLLGRYWLITNGNGREIEVQGEGVVGEQPHIAPGEEYQYTSGAVIETPLGTMQGHYEMVDADGNASALLFPYSVSPYLHLFINLMSTYLIGDVHGCYDELIALLKTGSTSPPGQDTLWLTGDLVARGPGSLDVLRYVKSLGDSVRMVLGNHDLHLLAVYAGISRNKPKDRITPCWKRRMPMSCSTGCVASRCYRLTKRKTGDGAWPASRLSGILRRQNLRATPKRCWRATPTRSSSMRCTATCQITGVMISAAWRDCVLSPMPLPDALLLPERAAGYVLQRYAENAPAPLKPWFAIPGPVTNEYSVVFGHWASLEGKGTPENIYALDTGCCWGGDLTCLRWEDKTYFVQPSNRQLDLGEGEGRRLLKMFILSLRGEG